MSNKTPLPAKVTIDGVVYWHDSAGNQIREDNIADVDKLRDEFVNDSIDKFFEGVEYLKAFKKKMWQALDEFLALSASEYGKEYQGIRGGFNLESFNGKYRIRVSVADTQQCDERIETARMMIKECLRKWSQEGINKNLETIIEDKYAVNDQGSVNVKEMLSLRRLKIDDPDWKKAMDAMTDSIFTSESKSYLRFYTRNNETGKFDQLKADFSTI